MKTSEKMRKSRVKEYAFGANSSHNCLCPLLRHHGDLYEGSFFPADYDKIARSALRARCGVIDKATAVAFAEMAESMEEGL